MKPSIRPRNPFVAAAKFLKAGSHRKTVKALRRDEMVQLQKVIKADDRDKGQSGAAQTAFMLRAVWRANRSTIPVRCSIHTTGAPFVGRSLGYSFDMENVPAMIHPIAPI